MATDTPSTVKRSSKKAQTTFERAHDSAVESYGEGERAHRTAFSALKHSFEKVGDHWEEKAEKGPSDAQAARSSSSPGRDRATQEGVDANATKEHLLSLARRLEVSGRSRMNKEELVEAIKKANRSATRNSRS